MALRATIFKLDLHVADMVRGYYNSHSLTVARHPSETDERMMARVLAFALYADERLAFTRGLAATDEPALWEKDFTGAVLNWIELGHPDQRRVLQASGKSGRIVVLCYGGHASQVWWDGIKGKLERVRNLSVVAVAPTELQALAGLAKRSMNLHAVIEEGAVLVSSDDGSVSVHIDTLR